MHSPCYLLINRGSSGVPWGSKSPYSQALAYKQFTSLILQVVGRCFFFFIHQNSTMKKQVTMSFLYLCKIVT